MNYKEFFWCGYHWRSQERWGDCHQDKSYVIYDGNMIKLNDDGSIALHISKNKKNNKYSIGLMSCIEQLGYGTYELEVKLPQGNNLWPSFWMWSYTSWPPEIDIFEGYSGNDNYHENKFLHTICPNIHYGDSDETHRKKGAVDTLSLLTYKPTEKFHKYTCEYTPNYIAIFYDGVPTYFTMNRNIMKSFREHMLQNVIINTSVTKDFTDNDLQNLTPMIIRNFKYTPLEN